MSSRLTRTTVGRVEYIQPRTKKRWVESSLIGMRIEGICDLVSP